MQEEDTAKQTRVGAAVLNLLTNLHKTIYAKLRFNDRLLERKVRKQLSAATRHLFTWLSLWAAVGRKNALYVCVRTGQAIKHIGAEGGAECREGPPRRTSKFCRCVCVFRAPDLVSPAV